MFELISGLVLGAIMGGLAISQITQRFYFLLERDSWNEYRKFINGGEPTLYRRKGE